MWWWSSRVEVNVLPRYKRYWSVIDQHLTSNNSTSRSNYNVVGTSTHSSTVCGYYWVLLDNQLLGASSNLLPTCKTVSTSYDPHGFCQGRPECTSSFRWTHRNLRNRRAHHPSHCDRRWRPIGIDQVTGWGIYQRVSLSLKPSGQNANYDGFGSFSQQFPSLPVSERPLGCIVPFRVCWLVSDTSASFNYLAQNAADVSITYHATAEKVAMRQGIADRCENAWRDHWMLVGQSSFS